MWSLESNRKKKQKRGKSPRTQIVECVCVHIVPRQRQTLVGMQSFHSVMLGPDRPFLPRGNSIVCTVVTPLRYTRRKKAEVLVSTRPS